MNVNETGSEDILISEIKRKKGELAFLQQGEQHLFKDVTGTSSAL